MKNHIKILITMTCLCLIILAIPKINFDNGIQVTSITYEEMNN